MRIAEVRLTGFGKFKAVNLFFPGNFKMIVGHNEAGKTTIVDAISGVLFGFRRTQKSLRERYRPWGTGDYSASILLVSEDGTRYLVGRDFLHDRLEVFRGQGVKLEPLPEGDLERILQDGLGVDTPQLFESTLLIRQPEVSLVVKDRMAVSRLAEALGRKLTGGDENVAANQALRAIQERLAKVNTTEGPGSLTELAADVAAREKTLAQIEQGYQRYAALIEERDRLRAGVSTLEAELNEYNSRIETAKAAGAWAETRKRLEAELEQIRKQIALVNQAAEGEEPTQPEPDNREPDINPDSLARAEELANRLAALDVELRYKDEEFRQYQTEIDLLEREIAATKAKMEGLDESLLDPGIQSTLSSLIPLINKHSARLGDLFPQMDRLLGKLRGLRTMRLLGFGLGFLTAGAAIVAGDYLPKMEALGVAGVAALIWLLTAFLVFRSGAIRKSAKRINTEIEEREAELKAARDEAQRILNGKTTSQYQAEMEACRLYRNDLWHLEQALAQKRAMPAPTSKAADLAEELNACRRELAEILAAAGCKDLEELRVMARSRSAQSSQNEREDAAPIETERTEAKQAEIGLSFEELRAREAEIRAKLDEIPSIPLAVQEDLTALVEERDVMAVKVNEARLRLAELGAEIRNYQEFILVRDRFEVEEGLAEARNRLGKARVVQLGLSLAAKRLEEAIFEARAHLGPELQEHTGQILSEITGGRYNEVQIDFTPGNLEIHLRSPETGALVEPGALSMGTVDQLYFALRIALAHQLTHGRRFPLILDDPFASFDRERLVATIKMLVQLSRMHQIIWFTLDQSLAELIKNETGMEPSIEELSALEAQSAAGGSEHFSASAEPPRTRSAESGFGPEAASALSEPFEPDGIPGDAQG